MKEFEMYEIIYRMNFEDWLVYENDIGHVNSLEEAIDIFYDAYKSLDANYHELDEFIENRVFQNDLDEEEKKELLEVFSGGFGIEINKSIFNDFDKIICQYFSYDYFSHTTSTDGIIITISKLNNEEYEIITKIMPNYIEEQ